MGTGLVPIDLFHVIIQSNVVLKVVFEAIAAPPAGNLFPEGVHPDRRAASCHQDLRAQEAFAAVHQIPDVVRTFHPLSHGPCTAGVVYLQAVGDAVRNVPDHPAKLLFACLALLFYCTHFIPFCFAPLKF